MNDTELDRLLTMHGATWREEHPESAVVDWARVTAASSSRRWFVVVGVAAVVAAAVVGSIAIGRGSHRQRSGGAAAVAATPVPPDPSDVQHGSPTRYFGLVHGGVKVVTPVYSDLRRERSPVVAIGGTHEGVTLYDVRPAARCRSVIEVTSYVSSDLLHGRGIALAGEPVRLATIAGGPVAVPIAVSVRAGELAMVGSAGCIGRQQIVFVNLGNGAVIGREPLPDTSLQIDSLAWSADGQQLAYRLEPSTFSDGYGPAGSDAFAASGTHVLNIHGPPYPLADNPRILPTAAPHGGGRYGPVFWWHDGWAATFNGTLYRLDDRGGLAGALATDFPNQVDSVSVDPTEAHLLIGSGPAAYRWDYNRLRPLPQHLSQPSW